MSAVFRKEILQFFRSFFFVWGLGFQIMISLLAMLTSGGGSYSGFYTGICGISGMLISAVAISVAGSRWHRELGDDSLDMRLTTPLSIRQIIAGKVLSLITVALLPVILGFLFIAVGPGRVHPRIWQVSLPLCLSGTVVIANWMLAFSTLHSNVPRFRFDISGVVAVICVIFAMVGYGAMFDETNKELISVEWLKVAVFFICNLAMSLSVIYGAVSPASSNRILPLRLMLIVCAAAVPPLVDGSGAFFCLLPSFGALLIAVTERMKQSRRVVESVRRLPWIIRPLYLLFSSGAVNGVVFSLISLVVIFAAGWCTLHDLRNYAVLFFYAAVTLNIRARRESRYQSTGGTAIFLLVTAVMSAAGAILSIDNGEIGGLLVPFSAKSENIIGYCGSIITAIAALILLAGPVKMMVCSCRREK